MRNEENNLLKIFVYDSLHYMFLYDLYDTYNSYQQTERNILPQFLLVKKKSRV